MKTIPDPLSIDFLARNASMPLFKIYGKAIANGDNFTFEFLTDLEAMREDPGMMMATKGWLSFDRDVTLTIYGYGGQAFGSIAWTRSILGNVFSISPFMLHSINVANASGSAVAVKGIVSGMDVPYSLVAYFV